jgi:Raf kinase inhibitor-like YbhB/YbcL family protein
MATKLAFVSVLGVALAACGTTAPKPSAPPGVTPDTLAVTSKSFAGAIPVDYSCDGSDKSPQLTWSSTPVGTKSIAVVLEDPEAPGGLFTHWILFNVPGDALQLAEGVDAASIGARVGENDFKAVRYGGPCPPKYEVHHYYFRVYALNAPLSLPDGATRDAVLGAMSGHVLAEGALVGTFSH